MIRTLSRSVRFSSGLAMPLAILFLSASAVAEPNLQMFTFTIDPIDLQIPAGENLEITYVVRNDGNSESPATTMRVYYSSNDTIAPDDELLTEVSIESLAPGAMTPSAQIEITIPIDASPGTRWVGAIVDPDKLVSDANRNDNSKRQSLTITEPADLTISMPEITTIETAYPGGNIQVVYTVINGGKSRVTDFITRLYYSEDQIIDTDDTVIDYEGIASVGAETDTGSISASVALPLSATAGKRFIGAIADPDNTVVETNDSNNARAVPLTILPLTCFGTDSHSPDVCSGYGACVGPDTCECDDNWGGEQCEIPLLADDNITDEGSAADVIVVQDVATTDMGQPDAGPDGAADQGVGVDTAVADTAIDASGDATVVEEEPVADDGGCGQSRPAPLAPLLVAVFVAFLAVARRRLA